MAQQRAIWLGVLVVVVAAGAWWWHARGRGAPAPAAVATGSAPAAGSAAPAAAAAPSAPVSPAAVSVAVSGDRGPLAGAAVRLAPDEGEVVVAVTGADGVARAEGLAPGAWAISASAAGFAPAALAPQQLAPGQDARLAVTLQPGGVVLQGSVSDVSGGPIAGARVDAARLTAARPDAAVASALTGPDGRYRLTVAPGMLLVAARSPDYAAQSRLLEVGAAGATASFALVPGGAIEGVVLDESTRQPVPGATVDAERERAGAVALAESGGHRAVAGPDGRFRIGGLRPGVYELGAAAGDRFAKEPAVVGLGVAEQVGGIELLVGGGPAVRGTVLDERDAPVANAKVTAAARGHRGEATTDERGAFVLERLPPGAYRLHARGDDHLAAGATAVELGDRAVTGVVVRVRRGLAIAGRVDPPQVADVSVEPRRDAPGMMPPAPVRTGPDGRFRIAPVAPGAVRVAARAPSGDQGEAEVEAAPGMAEIVVRLEPGAAIAGRVTDGAGQPVAGATVMASPVGGTERTTIVNGVVTSGAQTLTNAAGAYELGGLAAGEYRVNALDAGRPAPVRGRPPQVKLGARERRAGVDFAIDRSDGVIRGVVLGPDGSPLADAWVSAQQDLAALLAGMAGRRGPGAGDGPRESGSRMITIEATDDGGGTTGTPTALTDAQGRFELRGLARTPYEIVAEAKAGKLRARQAGVVPDAELTLRATGLSTLSGKVRGPQGPAALFTVELEGPTRAQRTFTGGSFELGRVTPGAYVVRVRSSEGNGEARVEVAADAPSQVEIALVPNAVVTGVLVDAEGKPLAGLVVAVVEQRGESVSVSIEGPPPVTGPDGRFRVEHAAGPAALVVLVPPKPFVRRGLALEPGKTLDLGQLRVETKPPAAPGAP